MCNATNVLPFLSLFVLCARSSMGDVSSCLLPTIVNDSLAVVDCPPDPSRYSTGMLTFVHSVDPKGRLVLSDLSTYFQGSSIIPVLFFFFFSSFFLSLLCYLLNDLRRLHCLDIGVAVVGVGVAAGRQQRWYQLLCWW